MASEPTAAGGASARKPRLLTYLCVLLLIPLGVWSAYRYTERSGIDTIRDAAAHRIDIYENTLTSELARYTYLPSLLSLNPDTVRLLQEPGTAALTDKVNRYLAAVNRGAHSNTLYIMDLQGKTLASSNWDQPITFVGMNFAYRPYFLDALAQGHGVFYGLGTTSKEAGYFYAERVYAGGAGGKVVGIATVKINLDKIEPVWKRGADTVVAADANGVIFLSTFDPWKYKSLIALSSEARASIAATRQYDAPGALEAIGLVEQNRINAGTAVERFASYVDLRRSIPALLGPRFLAVSRPVSGTDWKIVTLSNIKPAESAALNVAVGTGLGLAFVTVFVLFVLQRRRIIAQELATKSALRRLNDELERKVSRRTDALSHANKSLKVEIAERKNTEAVLKSTLQELMQAGKMAALGQMSASITHELNQPLAALRTLSDNALIFIQRGQVPGAQKNLEVICDLTERMGKITRQLKRFARKSPAFLEPVSLHAALANALFLLDARLRRSEVRLVLPVRTEPDVEVYGWAEATRLEQVLVNLIANALDAMTMTAGAQAQARAISASGSESGSGSMPATAVSAARDYAAGELTISIARDADDVSISVHDSGPGLTDEALAHLFEPFFTTKDQGEGLGLGLTISLSIVQEFGGALSAHNRAEGGAEFIIRLRAATPREPDAR
ncbi:ATP-binding protein [Burkholderia sp. L27(2015)]|uniref:ATP-binding protein n=1 Tax=Burkholderia sp. L27(2015) TaxID=1641858 RepID=UPI00131CBA6E|nr:ATP-binding protein [Burkholderia sp. L27(2015)]